MKSLRHHTSRTWTRLLSTAVLPMLALGASLAAHAAIPDLIFSEYVEGSGSNKAIEIYNGTGAAVDLSAYAIQLGVNGGALSTPHALAGTLADGDVFVIVNNAADQDFKDRADELVTQSIVNFNGDDALVLVNTDTSEVVDSIGQLGTDPGSAWGTGSITTKEHTLRRKSTICQGDTTPDDAFDPATEWDSYAQDTYDGLGSHIADCATPPVINLSIDDVSLNEGDSGTTSFTFTVTLDTAAPAGGVSFDVATADGTATTADADYTAVSTTGVSIAEGNTTATVTVDVTGDTTVEQDETFTVNVSNASAGVTIADGEGTGTILNDDASAVTISVDNPSQVEGNSSTGTMSFTVQLSEAAPTGGVSFDYATADDSAEAGSDYVAITGGSGSIAEGATSTTIAVTINGDTDIESDESFKLNLSNITGTGVAPTSLTANGTIQNDDEAVTASLANASMTEGNSGTTSLDFTLLLDKPAPYGGVAFSVSTTDGTAEVGSDFDAPAGSGSIAEGATSATISVPVHGDTDVEGDEVFTLAVDITAGANVTPTSLNATGTIQNDDIATLAIHDIQGAGDASPHAGETVHTTGNIVTAVGAAGFYVQTPDGAIDADPATSEGVYVYTGGTPTVQVGDSVSFDAEVSEYYTLTELGFVANLTVDSSGNSLPAPIVFDDLIPSPMPAVLSCVTSNFECFEGMRIQIDNGYVYAGNQYFSSDPYGEVSISTAGKRPLREPGLVYGIDPSLLVVGDNDAAGTWDGNPEVFEMDADWALPGFASRIINGGSRFHGVGVLGFEFGDYEFQPTELTLDDDAPMPRPVPVADASTLRIGEFNVERYCDANDDRDGTIIKYTCSGSTNEPDASAVTLKTARLSQYIGEVLELPDVIGLEEVENITVLQTLADKIEADYGVTYTPELIEGHDPGGIDVGYLVNGARVTVLDVEQLAATETWTDGSKTPFLHDRPPLLLKGTFHGDGGLNQPFMTIVVHMKARTNTDKADSDGVRDREKRLRQAYSLAQAVQALQDDPNNAGIPLTVVGDFNAYEFTDGLVDIVGMASGRYDFAANLLDLSDFGIGADANVVNPKLWNALLSLPEGERYSFLFTQNFGTVLGFPQDRKVPTDQALDHALLNEAARDMFVRMDFGRADQDGAVEVEKNGTGAIGASDHDGFVVQLTTDRIFADGFENRD